MTKEKWKGHFSMWGVTLIFALNIPIAKSIMPDWFDPLGLSLFRILFATAAFWTTSLFLPPEPIQRKKDYLILMIGGFFGMSFNQLSFIEGLSYTSPVYAAILGIFTPLITMFISALWLKEPITWRKALGVVIGGAGALFVILYGSQGFGSGSMLGNILVVFSCLAYAIYVVVTRPITLRYSPITLMKWMFLFGSLYILPFGLSGVVRSKALYEPAPWDIYVCFGYVLLLSSFVAYIFVPYSLKRLRPTTVTSYNYAQPLIASFAAIVIGQDTLSWDKPVAAIIIFTGVYFVTSSKSRNELERETGKDLGTTFLDSDE